MRRTAGIENKMRTRVSRREKGSDRLPPHYSDVTMIVCRKRGPKSGARSFPEWRIFSHNELGDIFLMTRARHCSKLTKASHAQRTPLNMGALHCVTDNHMHIYTARTSGEVKDMRRPLRFRTSTRGFATTVELQQAMSRGPVLARRLRRRQGGNRRELRGRGSAMVERWWLRVEQPHAPAACASWQPHHATRRCSSTMSSIGT